MTDIIFGQSYFLRFDPKLWAAMQPFPPLGTLYAASYLRERGYQVAVFDAMLADSETEWVWLVATNRQRFYEDNFELSFKMCLLGCARRFTMITMARQRAPVIGGADASRRFIPGAWRSYVLRRRADAG
jgi:hypothetical protein